MPNERFDASVLVLETWEASAASEWWPAAVGDSEDAYNSGNYSPPSGTDGWKPGVVLDFTDSSNSTSLKTQFRRLVAEWKEDSEFLSSPVAMAALPSYLAIIGLGKAVVPLLLEELSREPDQWFSALAIITGTDPVDESMAGDITAMSQAWLQWGQRQGYM